MTEARIEGQPDIRFGLYLRPSAAISRAQAEIHDLVARQYGSMCAGRFMPHATIKGFFRSDAALREMVTSLEPVMTERHPFVVTNRGPIQLGRHGTVVLDIHHNADGSPNSALIELHHAVFGALEPLVRSDCDFTPRENALDQFHAHLTLLMGDIPAGLGDELFEFIRDAEPIGVPEFTAERLHLVALRSQNWDGAWWETLQWTLLHSWKLGDSGVPVCNPTWNVPR